MLPDATLSLTRQGGAFLPPRNQRGDLDLLIDYEQGGTDIGDASAGLQVKTWTGQVLGADVVLAADGVGPTTVLSVADITEFAFTFDQQMRVFVTYVVNETDVYFYWYDNTLPGYTTTQLPSGCKSPRCTIDDKRPLQGQTSDIILAYVRAGKLYFRAQRDRYGVEYELAEVPGQLLVQCGLSDVNRFQFLMKPET